MAPKQVKARPAAGAASVAAAGVEEPPAPKERWFRTRKGKKDLQRSVEHRRKTELQPGGLEKLREKPEWFENGVAIGASESWLHEFRRGGKVVCARLCTFLLQMLTILIKTWEPRVGIKKRLGMGQSTSPRYALLWHHYTKVDSEQQVKMRSMGQVLFLRALQEGEGMKIGQHESNASFDLEGASPGQCLPPAELLTQCFEKVLKPMVLGGILPGFARADDAVKDYENLVWKDLCGQCILRCFTFLNM